LVLVKGALSDARMDVTSMFCSKSVSAREERTESWENPNSYICANKINKIILFMVIFCDQQNAQEGGKEKLSSLRRHYPDQVCGYFLSIPLLAEAPRYCLKKQS
jgi:hypothetical protein